MSIFAREKS